MSSYKFYRRSGAATMPAIVCSIVFCVFSFIFLYFYQADLLTMQQHVLSHGLTTYNSLVGAVLITLILQLLQWVIDVLTKRTIKLPALTYVPSVFLLSMLTDVSMDIDRGYTVGKWALLYPFILIAFSLVAYLSAGMVPNLSGSQQKTLWRNLLENILMLSCLFSVVILLSNDNRVFHARMKMENLILSGKIDEALQVDEHYSDTDSSLTMLRAFALSQKGQLGEHLFEYSLKGGSDALLPNGTSVKVMLLSDNPIYNNVGGMMVQKLRPLAYLEWMTRHHRSTSQTKDYLLCAYLLDKKIDKFAREIVPTDSVSFDSLPKHYREALILYNHQRSNPVVTYKNDIMDADYSDLQAILHNYQTEEERKFYVRKSYGTTYWYYYLYGEK